MSDFKVGQRVLIAPDFSNDGFERFEGVITAIDGNLFHIQTPDGEVEPWMEGNVREIGQVVYYNVTLHVSLAASSIADAEIKALELVASNGGDVTVAVLDGDTMRCDGEDD